MPVRHEPADLGVRDFSPSAPGGGCYAWDRGFANTRSPIGTATPETRFVRPSAPRTMRDSVLDLHVRQDVPESCRGRRHYAALGVPWEQGQELPVGFTKKVIGFARVANNCAVCHTATYRNKPDETPTFVVATGPYDGRRGFLPILIDYAKDPRFNADNLMSEINGHQPDDRCCCIGFHHSNHQEAPDRTRNPVRLDLPQGFSRLGPRSR
jgi:hypothetical protein